MIIFIGDVHGEFEELRLRIIETRIQDSFFIQVGDFGVGFKVKEREHAQLSALSQTLKQHNNALYAIRGNHDDPSYFKVDSPFSNLIFLKDYSLLTIEGKNILLAGGAISVDRSSRVLNVSHWPDEGFVFNETLVTTALAGVSKLDVVVTHNAPAEFHPTEINQVVTSWASRDHKLIGDLAAERQAHSSLLNALLKQELQPKLWLYGHYHYHYQGEYEGIHYRILDTMEFVELPEMGNGLL